MEPVKFTAPVEYEHKPKKKFPNKVALIDADRYKHVVTYRVFQELESGKEHNKRLVNGIIEDYLYNDIFSKFECKAYIFCFSAPSKQVFRNHIAQEKKYKGNRDNKPDHYDYDGKYEDMAHVFEYIESRYTTLIFSDLEADDVLSMLQHPERTFIFSHDKDLKQVIGFHYNMNAGFLEYTTESNGLEMLMGQMLKGDTVDNIPGLQGFGDKALEKWKEECSHVGDLDIVMMALKKYTDKYGVLQGVDTFAEMWHLLSMRINRGKYCKEKYATAFALIESLTKPPEVL
jgi:5'-3' exonuclease